VVWTCAQGKLRGPIIGLYPSPLTCEDHGTPLSGWGMVHPDRNIMSHRSISTLHIMIVDIPRGQVE
jgi:hypothetical protein